ncbi:MAG: helix-turn-helix domain-containing protein [Ketobacteraceae bacterium]|nr:helix-turn-helix domain-containing protein [Ketobacteraceae bacterium]
MIEREQLKFPSILFQFLDGFFEQEPDQERFRQTLNNLCVTEEEFRDPAYSFNGKQIFRMLEMLRNTSVDEPAAFRVLQHLSISNLGMAGIAGLTAVSLKEAVMIALKVYPYFMPAVEFSGRYSGDDYRLEATLLTDFGESNGVLMEIILGAMKQLAEEAIGKRMDATITLAHTPAFGSDKSSTKALYETQLGCTVAFDADVNALILPKAYLDTRLKRQNPIMHTYAQDVLEKELAYHNAAAPLTLKVRGVLQDAMNSGISPSLESVADTLHMSPRTLSRKLAKENTHYKTLLNEVRFEQAKSLLKQTDISIKQLAARLGFASGDAFTRAFKSFTGDTPNQWRSRLGRK